MAWLHILSCATGHRFSSRVLLRKTRRYSGKSYPAFLATPAYYEDPWSYAARNAGWIVDSRSLAPFGITNAIHGRDDGTIRQKIAALYRFAGSFDRRRSLFVPDVVDAYAA